MQTPYVGPAVSTPHRVVVIGSGFGGLFGTQALRRREDVEVTLIAPTTHHLFQPLLYQVATGILSEGEIAPSTREVLARQKNARVVLGTVTARRPRGTHGHLAGARARVRHALRQPPRRRRRGPVVVRQRPVRPARARA